MKHRTTLLAAAGAGLVMGCGGGGGSEAVTTATTTDVPAAIVLPPEVVAVPDPRPVLGSDSNLFWFHAGPKLKKANWLLKAINGVVVAGWDPTQPSAAGMEFTFFGHAIDCISIGPNDPVGGHVEETDFSVAPDQVRLTGLTPLEDVGTRQQLWRPSGNGPSCSGESQDRRGPSFIAIDWDLGVGGFGLYTPTGAGLVGTRPLLSEFTPSGQDSAGTNSHILGTFVGWREAWNGSTPRRPWVGSTAQALSDPTARIYTEQSVTTLSTGVAAPGGVAQAKQQMMVTVLNADCVAAKLQPARPCQVQYLFNTAIARSGVSDWRTVSWFQEGQVSYDPAQGGIPVVDGPLKAVGGVTLDQASGLPLFTSRGTATQHGTFGSLPFDARISMEQLRNMMRITTASTLGKSIASLGTADLQAVWGPSWDSPAAWTLVQSHVGQEVYNDRPDAQDAVIGGKATLIYVGTAY